MIFTSFTCIIGVPLYTYMVAFAAAKIASAKQKSDRILKLESFQKEDFLTLMKLDDNLDIESSKDFYNNFFNFS